MKNIFAINNIEENCCFLCGELLTDANRTDEHVFPRWLQRGAGLWNQSFVLLNRTAIPYRQLTIPCCSECNCGCLAELESEVHKAFRRGYEAVRDLPLIRLFQWCGKVWYGLIFKELSLRADRKKADVGTILAPAALEQFRTHHIFLQSIRVRMDFERFDPASVFVMKTHRYAGNSRNFDYFDHILASNGNEITKAQFLAIRYDGIGVACVFEDLGLTKQLVDGGLGYADDQTLHPVQFVEVGCKIAYQHSLRAFSTHYSTTRVALTDEYKTSVDAWPTTLWKPQNPEDYKSLFKLHVGRLLDSTSMFDLPGLIPSFLMKDGQRIIVDDELRPLPLS